MSPSTPIEPQLPLAILLQPACTSHKWIRTNNSSHIFERPERMRAVMLGVCAGVAMKEKEDEEQNITNDVTEAGAADWKEQPGGEEETARDRSVREATPDLANLLGGLSLTPEAGSSSTASSKGSRGTSRPSRYIYLPPVAFSPSPIPYDLISPESNTATDPPVGTFSPTRARVAAALPPLPTLKKHPTQPHVLAPRRSGITATSGESETIIPGSLLINHRAARIVHCDGPPNMPLPYISLPAQTSSSSSTPSSLSREIPQSAYLPRLLHWSLRAPALIKQGKCEIPKFYDDDEVNISVGQQNSTSVFGAPSIGESGSSSTGPFNVSSPSIPAPSSRTQAQRLQPPTPTSRQYQPQVKDPHGRSPDDEGYGLGEETGFNQGDLYLGPGSVGAVEGCIRTVCQAVDLICGAPSTGVSKAADRPQSGNATKQGGLASDATSLEVSFHSAMSLQEQRAMISASELSHDTDRLPNGTSPSDPLPPHCKHAFCIIRPPGHHCGQDTPSGFCYVNNVAIGAMHAYIAHDHDRAIILDFDLHHGNGTQSIVMALNEATHTEELQIEAGKPSPPETEREIRLGRKRRGWKGFYGSLHDIWSYPCEDGDLDLIRDASVSLAGHGQHIENIHLEPYTSEADFYDRLYPRYLVLLDKAEAYLNATEADAERTAVFISAGFDACQFEHQTMQRHDRRVPASFFDRFTRDIAAFADKHVNGKVISVLEGGYSDRALASGAMSHVSGFLSPAAVNRGHWWDEVAMLNLEKATKKKRTGGLAPMSAESSAIKELRRAHELLGIFEAWGFTDGSSSAPAAAAPARRVGLRDRRKPVPDDASPIPPQKKAIGRVAKSKSTNTTPVHQIATPHKAPATEGRPFRRTDSREEDNSGLETPTHRATTAKVLVATPTSDFQKALDKMSSMSMGEAQLLASDDLATVTPGTPAALPLAGNPRWATSATESQTVKVVESSFSGGTHMADDRDRGAAAAPIESSEAKAEAIGTLQQATYDVEEAKGETAGSGKILLKFKLPFAN